MGHRPNVVGFALRHTSDSAFAARLADQLGDQMIDFAPKVTFPAHWVLAKQKSNAKVAGYAVTHCDDPATLDAIEAKAKRVTVREALACNPHLSSETQERMMKIALATGDRGVRSALTRRQPPEPTVSAKERLDEMLLGPKEDEYHPLRPQRRDTIFSLIGQLDEQLRSEYVNKVYEALYNAGYTWMVTDMVLRQYQALSLDSEYAELYDHLTVKPFEALDALDPSQQAEIIKALVGRAVERYRTGVLPLDTEVVKRLVVLAKPTEVIPRHVYRTKNTWFTPEAVDALLESPEWGPLLYTHELSDEQAARLVKITPSHQRLELFDIVNESRERCEMVMNSLDDDAQIADTDIVETVLNTATDSTDPLLTELIDRLTGSPVSNYLAGRWEVKDQRVLPDASRAADLVASCADVESTVRATMLELRRANPDPDYTHALIETLPYALPYALDIDHMADYVYTRLESTGADMEMAIDQLSLSLNVPLNKLCSTLRQLTALTAAK